MRKSFLIIAVVISIALVFGFSSLYSQDAVFVSQKSDADKADLLLEIMDTNGDGLVSGAEFMKFFIDTDRNRDSYLTKREVVDFLEAKRQRETLLQQSTTGPEVGQDAPNFALKSLDGKRTVKLSDYKGTKPVVLVFGSYT